ncbi:MAG: 2-dehydro-3-deoxyglucarate aldolase [Lautropia sp.]|nr:2-dehydro-3-deoxyglucarate aldolase [Lautropia sp.]
MGLPGNGFKASLASGKLPVGSWLMMDNPVSAEAMSWAGFDFLVVDMEHSAADVGGARAQMQAIAGNPACAAVVRVPGPDPVTVKKVLDVGAQTLMFPMVHTVQDALQAVAATRYPPQGMRGVAAMHRASRYGAVEGYLAKAGSEIALIAQIETLRGVEAAFDIASVDGVDALFIGPADLSADLGLLGQVTNPKVYELAGKVIAAARRAGKAVGALAADEAIATRYLEAGCSFIALASDLGFMMQRARTAASCMRLGSET